MALLVLALAVAGLVLRADRGGGSRPAAHLRASSGASGGAGHARARPARQAGAGPVPPAGTTPSAYPVGVQVLRLLDRSRTIETPAGPVPRPLVTVVRYPTSGPRGQAAAARSPEGRIGPFPLIVFGHGFAVTPAVYSRLLAAWARAGYVVAAPVFPLENADAPGGPNEADLINQPEDMRVVISAMLRLSAARSGPLAGLVDPGRVAVAGQSDGGDTALALAYARRLRDPRLRAAVILSGAELPGVADYRFARGEPPLLATQGTADTINPPALTRAFFLAASPPKYLLSLIGAEHLPPYSTPGRQLEVVQRVTIDFLDAYLKETPGALSRLRADGRLRGIATLAMDP